jgi:hypothetical protein
MIENILPKGAGTHAAIAPCNAISSLAPCTDPIRNAPGGGIRSDAIFIAAPDSSGFFPRAKVLCKIASDRLRGTRSLAGNVRAWNST